MSGLNQPSAKGPNLTKVPKVRILLLPQRTFGRHGVCAGLKILRTWFDSTSVHNTMGCRIVAIAGDCNSPVIRLRRFESCHPNNNTRGCPSGSRGWSAKPVFAGSNPASLSKKFMIISKNHEFFLVRQKMS